jgi:hypothetical protein
MEKQSVAGIQEFLSLASHGLMFKTFPDQKEDGRLEQLGIIL